ncbi:hypothetical protein JZ785_19115 [Alicyclobacillus curvatus]|nr:hypothetical protein JZ785_19115 [Alicyclobacillus curvatus]
MKKSKMTVIGASAVSLVTLSMMTLTAFAATDTFSQQYQMKQQQETTLWQEVQNSSSTSADIQALESTVTTINAQTTALYNALQTLNQTVANIPQNTAKMSELRLLQGRRQEIINANDKAWNNVVYDSRHHQMAAMKHDLGQHTYWSNQLTAVNAQIKAFEKKYGTIGAPYMGARPSLESSILHLQDSAISFTNEILQLQAQGSSTTPTSSQSSDSGNAATNSTSGNQTTTQSSSTNSSASN